MKKNESDAVDLYGHEALRKLNWAGQALQGCGAKEWHSRLYKIMEDLAELLDEIAEKNVDTGRK